MLAQPNSYPHLKKIHQNLYYILLISASVSPIEIFLKEKTKLPKVSGFMEAYPRPDIVVDNYARLLREMLIETAVFIRGHDEF